MGCAASKLDNEETVRRCKDRRRLMRDAVYARHHLATAHADYLRSLRLTGTALFTFAAGEPLSVSDNTPAVLLNPQQPPSPPPKPTPTPPPPPPPPQQQTTTTTKTTTTTTNQRRKAAMKLPHILSESSLSSSPRSHSSNFPSNFFPTAHSTTHSETSSVWDWDNFYPPPSPPSSEYFRSRPQLQLPRHHHNNNNGHYLSEAESSEYNIFHSKAESQVRNVDSRHHHSEHQDYETERSEYDFFSHDKHERAVPNNGGGEYTETEREEVHCSEWGDHYSTTTSSDDEEERAENATRSNFGSSSVKAETEAPAPDPVKDEKNGVAEMKVVVRHRDLKEIVEAIRDNFEKAAVAGDQLSEMLEIGRAQLDRSFSQLRKTVYHSSSLLSNLSSTWTSKPPLAVKYRLDPGPLEGPGGPKSLGSTLERLLAWEKKLYQEVKAREGVKIEHEKKLSALQSQEYKGGDEAKLDKTKASITRLQSLIIVTSQAVSTTSTAINGLRDSDLVPQLVELCHGIMYMWKSMHQYHEIQSNIVQQVRGLVNQSSKGHSTSELHKQATRDLESAVSAWHSSFCRLIKFQRDFILSVHGWFKLNLIPVNNDNVNNNNNKEQPSDVFSFCDEWKLALDRVPDTVASEAIKSFINVVHVISVKQSEELKIKKRTESASKELEKKSSSVRNLERKFYNSYSTVGIGLPDSMPDNGQSLDARDPLAEKKLELAAHQRRVEDEMVRHSKAVEVTRALTLNNLQTGLPGVFQALTSFSSLFTESLELVCTRSYAIK
ncbi:hypothetical protein RIF29_18303 [Crotalaria pallida]|uniref:Uncharacterized protein n=1 Tax=Crotalaria pallida TaxID=3830 RepID=A0AAN9FIM3_CROPI